MDFFYRNQIFRHHTIFDTLACRQNYYLPMESCVYTMVCLDEVTEFEVVFNPVTRIRCLIYDPNYFHIGLQYYFGHNSNILDVLFSLIS